MTDYHSGLDILVLSCGQTDTTQTDADERLTPMTLIGVSNNNNKYRLSTHMYTTSFLDVSYWPHDTEG